MLQKPLNNVCQIVSEGCCVELGNELVLDDVSFEIKKGTLVGVVGPNGGGKTTLFNTILGLVSITHGSMKIKGLNPDQAKGMIGYVPQREKLNWQFPVTARQVVQMGITSNTSFLPFLSKKDQQLIEESLNKVELLNRIDDRVDEALAYNHDYHFDGSQKSFLKHVVTEDDKTNKYITISNRL